MNGIFYVYCYLDPRKAVEYEYNDITFNYEPIYIGKGKGDRSEKHLSIYKYHRTRFYNKINSIINDGEEPICIIIEDRLTESQAFELEKHYINRIGRIENNGTLTNLSDGGEGQSGFRHSLETKRKMSLSRLGKKLKPLSDETKLKISLSKIGKPSSKKGKKLSDIVGMDRAHEIRKKLSEAGKKRIGEKNGMFGRNHTIESKLKMSENTPKLYGKDNPNYGRVKKESEKITDTWLIENLNGEKLIINNLNKYCRENNLNASCMRDIRYGRMKNHKGWIKVEKITNNIKQKKG